MSQIGMHTGEQPFQCTHFRRNVHAHPYAEDDEVGDFLGATLARLHGEKR
jgi:hypothetical protein